MERHALPGPEALGGCSGGIGGYKGKSYRTFQIVPDPNNDLHYGGRQLQRPLLTTKTTYVDNEKVVGGLDLPIATSGCPFPENGIGGEQQPETESRLLILS